jgi:hypothetical protein
VGGAHEVDLARMSPADWTYREAEEHMNRMIAYGLAGLGLLFVGIQLVPAGAAANPPVEEEVEASAEVLQVLRRACYDCHSNQTHWPAYSYVAPAKWLVRHDVREGREHLNFSTWNHYDVEERAEKWEEVAEELDEGKMPPWFYLPLHREARLSEQEMRLLREWARSQANRGSLGTRTTSAGE